MSKTRRRLDASLKAKVSRPRRDMASVIHAPAIGTAAKPETTLRELLRLSRLADAHSRDELCDPTGPVSVRCETGLVGVIDGIVLREAGSFWIRRRSAWSGWRDRG